jgi:hypothetical protein
MKSLAGFSPILILAASGFTHLATNQESQNHCVEGPPTYSQVIDSAFQFSGGLPAEFRDIDLRVVVRFLPSSNATESQVVLLMERGRILRLLQYRLRNGTPPISEHYNEILRQKPTATIEDILTNVTVEKVETTATDSVQQLVKQFFTLSIPTALNTTFCADGTVYELTVQTSSNEIRGSFSDCAYGKNTNITPIVKWMKAVRAQIR